MSNSLRLAALWKKAFYKDAYFLLLIKQYILVFN